MPASAATSFPAPGAGGASPGASPADGTASGRSSACPPALPHAPSMVFLVPAAVRETSCGGTACALSSVLLAASSRCRLTSEPVWARPGRVWSAVRPGFPSSMREEGLRVLRKGS